MDGDRQLILYGKEIIMSEFADFLFKLLTGIDATEVVKIYESREKNRTLNERKA